jgi:rhamnosyltransferase
VADRPAVITSGLLVRKSALDQAGGFRTDFFVDSVDIDFCLRLRRSGSRIVQDKRVRLPHSLGSTRAHRFLFLKVRVTHHPTWRLYWVFRNQTTLVKENWRRDPVWCLGAVAILVRWVLLTALYEAPRGRRLRAALNGFADGLRGRTTASYLPSEDVVSAAFDKAA